MVYHILLGGSAGDGIETMSALLEKLLKQSGFYVFTIRDFMSRIRGGHNFVQIRFGDEPIVSHCETLDGIFAMNEESFLLHRAQLKPDGFVLYHSMLPITDERGIALPFSETAKALGNAKVSTSVAIGAILAIFQIGLSDADKILAKIFKPELAAINLLAIQKGHGMTTPRYETTPQNLDQHILISGTNASTLGAAAAGLKFYSAYPMSPSTGILEYLLEHGEELGITVEQAEDEIAAINMAIGAAYAGAPAMTGTSGGGFSLMVEALGFAGIAEIPLVIENVQRPGPATGLPTRTEQSDLKFVISASQGEFPRMVIALRNHEDAFYQTARAFGLAKKYQIQVILLSDQYLGDSTATIPAFDLKKLYQSSSAPRASVPYKSYALTQNGISPRLIPGESEHLVRADSDEHDEYGVITESAEVRKQMMDKRMGKLKLLEGDLLEPEFIGNERCETLLIGFGSTYGAIKEAVTVLNHEKATYAALIFGDVYPLPTRLLTRFAAKAHKTICIEQNATGQLASLIREVTGIRCDSSILKYDGRQLSAKDILDKIDVSKGGRNW